VTVILVLTMAKIRILHVGFFEFDVFWWNTLQGLSECVGKVDFSIREVMRDYVRGEYKNE